MNAALGPRWRAAIGQWLRRLASPFPAPPGLALGIFVSPLDECAAHLGAARVNDVVASPEVAPLARAVTRFLDDERGTLALKKAAHVAFDQRLRVVALRADPPEAHGFSPGILVPAELHPLDCEASRVLAPHHPGLRPPPPLPWWTPLATLAAVTVRAAGVLSEAMALVRRHGRSGVERRRVAIGAPMGTVGDWQPWIAAARDAGLWRDGSLVLVADGGGRQSVPEATVVALETLALDGPRWRRQVFPRLTRLAVAAVFCTLRHPRHPWVPQLALDALMLARDSLSAERLSDNFAFRWYADVDEYTTRHITKAVILGRVGTTLVRWPHSAMDAPGAVQSFLGYPLYLSGGPYTRQTHGDTWWHGSRTVAVGTTANDRHHHLAVAEPIRAAVDRHKAAGGRLAVYFLPSPMAGRHKVIADTLAILARRIASRSDWLLLIKPKGRKSERMLDEVLAADPALAAALQPALVVHYGDDGIEPCPSGWANQQMDMGVGVGSVPIESLCRNRAAFLYYPIIHHTPATERLRAARLMHNDIASFDAALADWLDDPASFDLPVQWFRDSFDPFGDDQALTRVAEMLLSGAD